MCVEGGGGCWHDCKLVGLPQQPRCWYTLTVSHPKKSILNRIIMSLLDKLLFNIYKCKHVFIVLLLILLCRRPSCFAAIHCYRPPLHLKTRNKKSKDATGPSTVSGWFQMGSLVACGLHSLITTVAIMNTTGGDVDEKKKSFFKHQKKVETTC